MGGPPAMDGVDIACIGPITSATAKEFGLTVHLQPDEYTVPALVDSIIKYYS